MDDDEARQVIREQNHTLSERIEPLFPEYARKWLEAENQVIPWLGRATQQWGTDRLAPHQMDHPDHLPPGLRQALQNVARLSEEYAAALQTNLPASSAVARGWESCGRELDSLGEAAYALVRLRQHLENCLEPKLEYDAQIFEKKVRSVRGRIRTIALAICKVRGPYDLLLVPEIREPPRYAQLRGSVLGRLLSEDLSAQIGKGNHIMMTDIADQERIRSAQSWTQSTHGIMISGLSEPSIPSDFEYLTWGVHHFLNGTIPEAPAFTRAYVALGLSYLEKVKEHMPDYAESSGRTPPAHNLSVTIRDNTFHGAQLAAQITNIDSTIAGVHHAAGEETAKALKALEHAVLSQSGLSDQERRDLLDVLADLAESARTAPNKRNRGRIKSALAFLTTAAAGATEIAKTLDTYGPVIHRLVS